MSIMVAETTEVAIDRAAQVWARLQPVTDPELDESVTDLGFVTRVDVDDAGGVEVGFRLPTYWCAANFAFLMADDMRRAVGGLSWVTKVTVRLDEHMYAEEINRGIGAGLSFKATFGDAANGELEEVRRIFLVKAFQRRQEALLTYLLGHGYEAAVLVRLRMAELAGLGGDAESRRLVERYQERRSVVGGYAGADAGADLGGPVDQAAQADELAFVDSEGASLDAAGLPSYLRALRRVGVNAEFNGALCRGLLAARYGDESVPQVEFKPIHFVRSHDPDSVGAVAKNLSSEVTMRTGLNNSNPK
jgi:metal-sulfur cluster biosynthetic enzyme